MKLLNNKKGFTISDMAPIAVAFIAVAVALAMGAEVISEINDDDDCASGYTYNSTSGKCMNGTAHWVGGAGETYQSNITTAGLNSVNELTSWLPTIALIVAAAIIIGIIVVYLARRFT